MPRKYDHAAVEMCFELYLRFNGQHYDRIETEMRRVYPGWSKDNLVTRGTREGWPDKYGWGAALERKLLAASKVSGTSSAEKLLLEVEEVRGVIKNAIDAHGSTDTDLIWQHRAYCQLTTDALARLDAGKDNFEAFCVMMERLMGIAGSLPGERGKRLVRELNNVYDDVINSARKLYGEKNEFRPT